jgi:hypothetical protein
VQTFGFKSTSNNGDSLRQSLIAALEPAASAAAKSTTVKRKALVYDDTSENEPLPKVPRTI